MIVPITTNALWSLAAGTTVLVSSMLLDANPQLFLFDKMHRLSHQDTFDGKTIWITGASSGLGAELAYQLSMYNNVHLILSARNQDRLETVAATCRQTMRQQRASEKNEKRSDEKNKKGTVRVSIVPFDLVGSPNTWDAAIQQVQQQVASTSRNEDEKDMVGGVVDCVILNAGSGQMQTAYHTDPVETKQIFKVNTVGPIAFTQRLLQPQQQKNSPSLCLLSPTSCRHVVVTSSVGGKMGIPLSSSYAASKHALHGYFETLRYECPWLRVDLICPGTIDTPFHRATSRATTSSNADDLSPTQQSKERTKKQLKMSVERCAQLYLSSIAMNSKRNKAVVAGGGNEYWIAQQPTLFAMYLKQYCPSLFHMIMRKVVGPLRIQAFQDGKDLYDPETWKKKKR